jgi:hypothetical protein
MAVRKPNVRKSTGDLMLGTQCLFANGKSKAMKLDTSDDPLTANPTINMQCKLLIAWFSVFSGDMTQDAISASGFWATVCIHEHPS